MENQPLLIEPTKISPDALSGLILETLTRDGTNISDHTTEVERVRKLIMNQEILIAFDPDSGTTSLIRAQDWPAD